MTGGLLELIAYGASDIYESEGNIDDFYNDWVSMYDELVENDKEIVMVKLKNNVECSIMMSIIEEGARYMKCNKCLNNFSYVNIRKWLGGNNSCPMCRSNWENNNIYQNQDE